MVTIGDSAGTTHLVPTAAQRQQSAVRYAQRAVDENVVVVAISSAGPEVSELAAIDTRGQVLIDSLVQPSRWRRPSHQVVQMFASGPSFAEVMTTLVTVVNGRTVVTYGEKTAEVIRGTAVRVGLDLQHLADSDVWPAVCLLPQTGSDGSAATRPSVAPTTGRSPRVQHPDGAAGDHRLRHHRAGDAR